MPSAFFIESCGSLISNRACEPRSLGAGCGEPGLGVSNQRARRAGTTRLDGRVELIELVTFDDAKADRSAAGTHDSNVGKKGVKPLTKTRQCTESREFRRHNLGMSITPTVVPELRQMLDLAFFRGSDVDHMNDAAWTRRVPSTSVRRS